MLFRSVSQSRYEEVEPVVVNTDNRLIGGHQRVGIYLDLGIDEIDVRVPSRKLTLEEQIYEMLGIDNKRVCFWVKNNQNPTPQIAFNKACEPCVYGTTGRPFLNPNYKNLNEVLNREVGSGNEVIDDIIDLFNLWVVKRDSAQDYQHPTQKPIILHEKPLKRCTGPGAIVLDLFGGSGSTLMACEQLNRQCRMCEIDPVFCQVIINRWEELTGQKAKKLV